MKSISVFYLRIMFCAAFSACTFINAYASHIVGGDLYYTHVSGNTYKITVALYGNCGEMSSAAFSTLPTSAPQICIYNGDTMITSISLSIDTPVAGVEITPLCAGDTSQCTNLTSIIPGVKKFVYEATYTFPYVSNVWRLIYGGSNGSGSAAGRAAAITNIVAPGSTIMQLTDTLNNTVYNNSNPMLTVAQQTFFCVNQHDTYNPGAVDPDSDSLAITLFSAANGTEACATTGGPITYIGAPSWPGGTLLSATNPLQVVAADSFSMNTVTGNMFFHSPYQRSVVVYNIREFRSGSFVGTSQREMSVIVVSCDTMFPCMYVAPLTPPPPPPNTGVGGVSTSKTTVSIYPNPTTIELTISMTAGAYSAYTITNAVGNVQLQQQLNTKQTVINVSALPPGLYYITFKGEAGTNVQKFVKM